MEAGLIGDLVIVAKNPEPLGLDVGNSINDIGNHADIMVVLLNSDLAPIETGINVVTRIRSGIHLHNHLDCSPPDRVNLSQPLIDLI